MLRTLPLVIALVSTHAHARLGETPEECAKRYGELCEGTVKPEAKILVFAKDSVQTTCWFRDGKCATLHFVLSTPDLTHAYSRVNAPRFEPDQVQALLEANGSGWEQTEEGPFRTQHDTKDGTRTATSGGAAVIIQLKDDIAARKKEIAAEGVTRSIKGF